MRGPLGTGMQVRDADGPAEAREMGTNGRLRVPGTGALEARLRIGEPVPGPRPLAGVRVGAGESRRHLLRV